MQIKSIVVRTLTVLSLIAVWFGFVFVSAFYGWWMKPVVTPGDSSAFFQHAVSLLESENGGGNSALVLIEDGKISDDFYSVGAEEIDQETVFSTASLSKWITAAAVMKLVQDNKLGLDDPAAMYLTRWQFPPSEFEPDTVSIRHLLSHTAGLSDGLGFGDYFEDENLPSLEQTLNNPRTSSGDKVSLSVTEQPGSRWNYSGGSYLILELIVEEVSGAPFEDFVQEEILDPLAMRRSTYQILSSIDNNAGSYFNDGGPAPVYKYASSAATAFATSAADLTRFALAQFPESNVEGVLNSETVESMRIPHGRTSGADIWGLGTMLYSPTPEGDFVFGHDGGNDPAINSTARINPSTNDGIVLLETGHPSIATQIGSDWVFWQTGYPDFLDTPAVISSMALPAGIGTLVILIFAFVLLRKKPKRLKPTADNN
ncbi:MAG: serine hydrolase domain-containing protein [Pseudohongiellaceae bacterium]